MPYSQITSIALWIPFLLVALIAGAVFAVSGYRSGLWRALLAFAATIVAAAVSVFLSGFTAYLLSGRVLDVLPGLEEDAGMLYGFVRIILRGVVQNVLALIIFFLLMFLTTIILRWVSRKIKLGSLTTGEKQHKLAGMLTGMACAAVYSILLLLPLYGTIAAYAPAAERMIGLEPDGAQQEQAFAAVLAEASSHPLVAISDLAPFSAVYDGTTRFHLTATRSVSAPKIADTMEHTAALLQNVANAPADRREAACVELVSYLRGNFTGEHWVYDLSATAIGQLRESLPMSDGALSECLDALDVSPAEFEDNMNALLDFVLYALEHDGYTIAMEEDCGLLYESEIVQRAGALANHSEQTVAVKNLLMIQMATELCGDDPDAIQAFYERYRLELLTEPAQQTQEAQALMLLMGFGESSPAEFFVRHPSLGQEALAEIIGQYGMKRVMGLGADWIQEEGMVFPAQLEEDPALQTRVLDVLGRYADRPVSGESFGNALRLATVLYEVITVGGQNYYHSCSPAELVGALEILGRESCTNGCSSAGGETWDFFFGYAAAAQEVPELRDRDVFLDFESTLLLLGAVKDGILPEYMEGYYEVSELDLHRYLSGMVGSDTLIHMAKRMVEEQGRDPLDLRRYLNKDQRETLAAYIEELSRGIAQENLELDGEIPGSFTIIDENGEERVVSVDDPDGSIDYVFAGPEPIFTPEERIEILCNFFGL